MKNFKKIICLCIALSLLITTAFAYSTNTLLYLGISSEGISDYSPATREILAYSLAGALLPGTECDPTDTAFGDVKADNKYSGYIKLVSDRGIMTGSGDGLFNPQRTVGLNEVSKTMVSLLGYEAVAQAKGGWPGGYLAVASALKLYRGVDTAKAEFTYADLKTMILNLLECPVPEESIYTENGQVGISISTKSGGLTYANKALDLYEYEAVIEDINYETYKATVVFGAQDDGSKYVEGMQKVFNISETLNVLEYENIPLDIVIYDDSVIVDVSLKDNYEIKYGVVDSVNNETVNASYNTSHINAITLMDDDNDYEFKDDCRFSYNNKSYSGKVQLLGKYVRIICEDDEIVSLSLWDLKYGGRITKVSSTNINFTEGADDKRISKISEAMETVIIIDGEIRDYKELKPGMVFSYYHNTSDGILVIVATEKKMYDVLYGINTSDNTLSLGEVVVKYSDDVYSSADNKKYVPGTAALLDFSNTEVMVTFDIYSCVRYVELYSGTVSQEGSFGYILGYDDTPTGFEGVRVKMVALSEEGMPTKVYNVSKDVEFKNGLTLGVLKSAIEATRGTINSGNLADFAEKLPLYEVEFDGKGNVKSFSKLIDYAGTEGMSWTGGWSSFIDDGNPYLVLSGKKIPIPNATPVFCIRPDGSDAEVYKLQYSTLRAKGCNSSIRLKFYGYEHSPELRMIAMIGDMHVVSGSKGMGIAERYGNMIDADGKLVKSVTVNGKTYRVMDNSTAVPYEGYYISYEVSLFDSGAVCVKDAINLKDDFANWNNKIYGNSTFYAGTITQADKLKIAMNLMEATTIGDYKYSKGDNICYYYQTGSVKYYGIDSNQELVPLEYQDISDGMDAVIGIEKDKNGGGAIMQVFVRVD